MAGFSITDVQILVLRWLVGVICCADYLKDWDGLEMHRYMRDLTWEVAMIGEENHAKCEERCADRSRDEYQQVIVERLHGT